MSEIITEERRKEYEKLLTDRMGFCITCNVICNTPELMFEHHSTDHEKVWIDGALKDPDCDCLCCN